jgi:hypothetical protein
MTPSHTVTATPSYTATPTATMMPTVTITPTFSPTGLTSPTCTQTPTATPGVLVVTDARFFPNPVTDAEGVFFSYKLSAPADKVLLKVFTVSGRKVLEVKLIPPAWGGYVKCSVPFDEGDGLDGLANGVYLYVFDAYEDGKLWDRKTGKLVILK